MTESDRRIREYAPSAALLRHETIPRFVTAYAMPDATPQHIDDRATRVANMRAAALGTTASHLISATAPPRA